MPINEFSDDGYSGTNFKRPGVQKLLEAVRRGEISCIVVKDLSRFGRKYLEVSKFIEQLFPYLSVRFISVGDHYDSNSHKGTSADIDIPIRNMINAMYSKDVSKKVKSAKQTQARQGKYINAFTSYGYKKDVADKHRIVIDEPAAEVVRRIFTLACEGQGPAGIAIALNADGILTPSGYKACTGSKLAVRSVTGSLWSNGTVIKILRDERYTGTFIGGKVEMGDLGTGKRIHKPKEEWIRIPEAHPAIISMETWDTAVANRGKHGGEHGKPDTGRILYKRVRCGYCGHVLRYRADGKCNCYYCETPRYTDEHGCLRDRYAEQAIVDAVKAVVRSQLAVMLDMEKLCRDKKKGSEQSVESAQRAAAQLDGEMIQLQAFKRQLYERYKGGTLEKTAYLKERETIETDINTKAAERDALLVKSDGQSDTLGSAQRFFGSFTEFQNVTELTDEMVNALVEAVCVFSMNRIEMRFSYRDELALAMLALERLQQG